MKSEFKKNVGVGCVMAALSVLNVVGAADAADTGAASVDAERIVHADQEPGNWLTTGRTYDEKRFSPLKQINARNVAGLGLAWSYDLDTHRGQEATPIVVDGVMYTSEAWSKVLALDAKTGRLL